MAPRAADSVTNLIPEWKTIGSGAGVEGSVDAARQHENFPEVHPAGLSGHPDRGAARVKHQPAGR